MTTIEEYELLLASISHEIRNPVTLISSYLQLMASLHPSVLAYDQWQPIQSEMEYLHQLLNGITSFHNASRIIRSEVDMNQWLPEYAAAAQTLIRSLADAQAVNRGIPRLPDFIFHTAAALPSVFIDPSKLRQVLDNLIRNALEAICSPEHTDKINTAASPNTITLSALQKDGSLCIMISDTGCGIPSKYIDTLFEPFVTHKKNGTGLGLAICKHIIDAHGGSISASSDPEAGTTFTVCLPADGKG